MAASPVAFSPVLTPKTIGVIAQSFEEAQHPEIAGALKNLQPFIQDLVFRFFVPITEFRASHRFNYRMQKLASEFEYYRLYLNIRLLTALKGVDLLATYKEILNKILIPILAAARQMEMSPELLASLVKDYLHVVDHLAEASEGTLSAFDQMQVQEFTRFTNLLHTATRFDFGLTAIFLVLERSINEPMYEIKSGLLGFSQKAMMNFAQASSALLRPTHAQRLIEGLESPRHAFPEARHSRQDGWTASHSRGSLLTTRPVSGRAAELGWLKNNKEWYKAHEGKWVVLNGEELIASDANYERARAAAKNRGIKRPFIFFVPPSGNEGFMGI